ncbi:hypothetical protein GCM10010191_60410 [Actinomadura vinacea]|uniref:Uncharacterized protein n=1 Tax=Actinomadura vinacea TaxID=115336 RepID=A0ABP5WV55_9ACTN
MGTGNSVTSCHLRLLVDEPAESLTVQDVNVAGWTGVELRPAGESVKAPVLARVRRHVPVTEEIRDGG